MSYQKHKMDKSFIIEVIEKTCTDINKRDRKHIINLIDENIPRDLTVLEGVNDAYLHRLIETVSASAFLYSKCPGNSDHAIDYKKLKILLTKMHSRTSLSQGIKSVKELGFIPEFCTINSTTVLRNMKNDKREKILSRNGEYLFNDEYQKILDHAIINSESKKVKWERQGKSPYSVASGLFYISSIRLFIPCTQLFVSELFNVTMVTVRNRYQALASDETRSMATSKLTGVGMYMRQQERAARLARVNGE